MNTEQLISNLIDKNDNVLDKDKLLCELIHFKSKFLIENINKYIISLKEYINKLHNDLNTSKQQLFILSKEINEYYTKDNKEPNNKEPNNKEPNKQNDVLKYHPQILINNQNENKSINNRLENNNNQTNNEHQNNNETKSINNPQETNNNQTNNKQIENNSINSPQPDNEIKSINNQEPNNETKSINNQQPPDNETNIIYPDNIN